MCFSKPKLTYIVNISLNRVANTYYKDIDKIYNRACRYYLGTHKFTPSSAMYGEMGFLPAIFHRQVNALRLWNRILGMSPERLTRKVLLLDCQSSVGWSKDIY